MSKVVQLIPLNLLRLDQILVLILLWGSPNMTCNTPELEPSVSVMFSIHDREHKISNNKLVWIMSSLYCLWDSVNSSHPMMTSSNGNIFRVTGPLWGESTGHRWIPLTNASDAELWCFLQLNKRLSKQARCWWFETPWVSSWRHCNENDHTIGDVIISVMTSLITSVSIVCSAVFFGCRSKKTSKFHVTGLREGKPPVTCEPPHKWPITPKMFPFESWT